ncbi:MAG: AAA family ATPase [Parvibaculum sp.]|uniref:AAA family ATPase n=1 Tax=Chelatococcus sp. TaxID=1953771 RepID=UPI001EBC533D|nr:AAA family ATPase [Chelatococcus sp.]MBX3506919.1 AAA family ATPase [Parvibaculum sp.]MBX3545556.1 AAA family ATPase [Chelatococcus sp.]
MTTDEFNTQAESAEVDEGTASAVDKKVSETTLDKMKPGERAEWQEANEIVRAVAAREHWSRPELCRRSGVPAGTLYPWLDGTYKGNYANVTERMRKWLSAEEEQRMTVAAMIAEPEFVETPTAREVLQALRYAQAAPTMAVITLGAGMGKTTTARHYAMNTPHVTRIVLRPTASTPMAVIRELARELGLSERRYDLIEKAIGEKLKRNGRHTLVIVDEAQNMTDKSVNELRHYMDVYKCGLALIGNEEVTNRWAGAAPRQHQGQIHRRVGVPLTRLKPLTADIDAYVDAWGFDDPEIAKLCRAIGRKPGALGQISETIKLAAIIAGGNRVTANDVKLAWAKRTGEGSH